MYVVYLSGSLIDAYSCNRYLIRSFAACLQSLRRMKLTYRRFAGSTYVLRVHQTLRIIVSVWTATVSTLSCTLRYCTSQSYPCGMRVALLVICLLLSSSLIAQRAFETNGHVIYEDARNNRHDLSVGFGAVVTLSGKVAVIRGSALGHNDDFDCNDKQKKNWITLYDPIRNSEKILFDRPVHFDDHLKPSGYCIFGQAELSPNDQILYLISPVYATAGKLAIIQLRTGSISYVPDVLSLYMIEDGPHRGELILSTRRYKRSRSDNIDYPYNPFIHVRADGQEVKIVSDEYFVTGGLKYAHVPVLAAYLKRIGGHITVDGERLP